MEFKELRSEDLDPKRFKPIKMTRTKRKKLCTSLCIPSYVHAYSLCISYIEKWFLSAFPEGYFKTVYVEGKHALDEFKKYSAGELVKRPKPSLAIIPQPDWSFNNENLNWQYGTINMNTRMTSNRDVFFIDSSKNLYLGVVCDLMNVNFDFKIKVNTRAKQIDLFKYIQMKLGDRGATHGKNVLMDFHVPYDLMIQLATDTGFQVVDGKITNVIGFLNYLNSKSIVPFFYKLRNVNGKSEFFIRQFNYVHIREPQDISMDDGERQGQISSNYILEYTIQVRFPSPRFYRYLSETQHDKIQMVDEDGNIKAYYTNFSFVPQRNSKGWDQGTITDYAEYDLSKPLEVDLKEFFDGSDLALVIEYVRKQNLAPEVFVDIQLFNARRKFDIKIDWENLKLTTIGCVLEPISCIVAYVDKDFFNTQLINIKNYYANRLE